MHRKDGCFTVSNLTEQSIRILSATANWKQYGYCHMHIAVDSAVQELTNASFHNQPQ